MVCSPARLAANRENAKRSSGPSLQGRLRSRLNALKHGLTGAGIALPNEDVAEIARRSNALHDELKPNSEVARLLVGRMAFLAVRLDRCQRHDTAMLSRRVRFAEAEFDEARLGQVKAFVAEIDRDPASSVRGLRAMPEGVAWMVENLDKLRQDLTHEDETVWGMTQCANLHALMGLPNLDGRVTRYRVLSDTGRGFFGHLKPGDCEGLSDEEKVRWARRELLAIIDHEIARLQEVRESLDLETIELDRAEAVDRALFDPSKEATLARKYEAATERGLYRALRELEELKKLDDLIEGPEAEDHLEVSPEPEGAPEPPSRPRGSLASFFQTALAPFRSCGNRPGFPGRGRSDGGRGPVGRGPGRIFAEDRVIFRRLRWVL